MVAHPENPASSPAPRTSSRSLGRDAVSFGDFRSGDSVLRVSPVSMVYPEPAVMSVCSSDSDPDMVDELCRFQPLHAPVSPVSSYVSMSAVESPSHYPVPAEPVVLLAVSSTQVYPSRVREERSSGTPDTSCYVPVTSPVTPIFSEGSLPLSGPESLPWGVPASLDSLLA